MRDRGRLGRAHGSCVVPTLTVTTTAPPGAALDIVVAGLVAARLRSVHRDARSATLRLGSFLRWWIFSDSMLLDVVRPLRTWAMQATVEATVLDVPPPTRLRVTVTQVAEHRWTVPHLLSAVESTAQVLRDRGFTTEVGEEGPASR